VSAGGAMKDELAKVRLRRYRYGYGSLETIDSHIFPFHGNAKLVEQTFKIKDFHFTSRFLTFFPQISPVNFTVHTDLLGFDFRISRFLSISSLL
jgi:hypothetical protein